MIEGAYEDSLRSRLSEPALFLGAPAIGVFALLGMGGVDLAGVFRHLILVSLLWFAFWSLKSIGWAPASKFALGGLAAVQTLIWCALIALHVGSAIAMGAWGQLLTWPMVEVYLKQAVDSLDVLGIPRWGVFALSVLAVFPAYAAWRVFRHGGAPLWRPLGVSRALLNVAFAVFAFGAIYLVGVSGDSFDSREREPLSLMLAPSTQLSAFYTWRIPPSPVREQEAIESRRGYVPAGPIGAPNIILVVVDALRHDRIGVNGYPRRLTPNIDEFARDDHSWVVSKFRSVCAESSCGLLALGRSKYPWEVTLSDFSLYEVLKRNGYRNYFFLSGDHTNFYGLRQTYSPVDLYVDSTEIPDSALNDDRALIDAFGSAPRFDGTPTFIQFHLMSTHGLGKRHPEHIRYTPQLSPYLVHLGRRLPVDVDVSQVVNHYDNGVVQLDAEFGRLMQMLESKGYLANAVVVLTGDHGELLGESGYVTHARSTEEAVLSPPMILRRFSDSSMPAARPFSHAFASQVDVAPTLLSMAGLPIPEGWSGVSLNEERLDRVIFFAQGSEQGLYALSNGMVCKVTIRGLNEPSKIEVIDGDGRAVKTQGALADELATQTHQWEAAIRSEVGPGWVAKDEVR